MKKQLIAPLFLAFGLAMFSNSTFAMKRSFATMNGPLTTVELETLKRDVYVQESNALLELIPQMPTTIAAVKFQSLFRGTNVRKETVLPSELADYLAMNINLLDFTDSDCRVDGTQLSKVLAREILAKKILPTKGKRLFKQKEEYSFSVQDNRGNFSHREVFKLPLDIWAKPVPNGIELELIGKELGGGNFKKVLQSRRFTIDLQTEKHEKKLEDAVVVQLHSIGDYQGVPLRKFVLQGLLALREAFTPEERQDPDLRIAGDLSLLDRINPVTGQIEARDVEYAGDFKKLSEELEYSNQIQVFADVATTLMKFHNKGLTHGDIKPQNILVSKGSARGFIADFDSLQASGIDKTKIHTRTYKDEILDNLGLETPFHDIFALALTATNILPCDKSPDRIRQAADEVISADQQTVAFIKSHLDILEQLRSNDKIKIQGAIAAINYAFPAFQIFLTTLQEEATPPDSSHC